MKVYPWSHKKANEEYLLKCKHPLLVKKLASLIKPEGSLIFSGAFSGGTLHLEENDQYNEFNKLDAIMESCNLKFQDKFAQFYFYKRK